ncbi:MAG: type II CAAX endopeptidase family protein [Methanomassiliicoccales archaeon]
MSQPTITGDGEVEQTKQSIMEIGKGGALTLRNLINILLPLALILSAEAFFFVGYPMECIWVHGLNVFLCLLLLVVIGDDQGLFQAFSLVSLIRILGLGMPLFFDLTLYNFVPIYLAAIVSGMIVIGDGRPVKEQLKLVAQGGMKAFRWVLRRPMKATALLATGVLTGYALANVEYAIISPEALIPEWDLANLLFLGVIMLLFVGFGEELLFRAILQRRVISKMGEFMMTVSAVVLGVVLSSMVFAAMHSVYLSLDYLAYVFIVGLLLGNLYRITGSLGYVSLIHGSINFFLFSFLPFGYLRLF